MLVIGQKELENDTVNVRLRDGTEIGERLLHEVEKNMLKSYKERSQVLWNA